MSNRQFYRTKITIEVLSEDRIPDGASLDQIINESINGEYSLLTTSFKETVLNGKRTANALLRHGTDPQFFCLNEKGDDIE